MQLLEWCYKWSIPTDALQDLQNYILPIATEGTDSAPRSEMELQQKLRLEASQKGCRLWRNNVGAAYTDGGFVRYGLANDSAQVNKAIKSADLIGIRPIVVAKEHLGTTIGQFMSVEVKNGNWRYRNTEHEKAQLKWAELIITLGGYAKIVTKEGTL